MIGNDHWLPTIRKPDPPILILANTNVFVLKADNYSKIIAALVKVWWLLLMPNMQTWQSDNQNTHYFLHSMSSWTVWVSSHTKLHTLCGSSWALAMSSPAARSGHESTNKDEWKKIWRILSLLPSCTTWVISRAFITAEKEKRLYTCSFRAWANRITLCRTVALWFTVPVQPSMSTATPRVIRWCLQKRIEIKCRGLSGY